MALTDNLISYWTLDEASGTRKDSVGTNDLTSNNNVGQAAGKLGNAALFVAASLQWLDIADNPTLHTGNIDFTWAVWAYLNPLGGRLLGRWTGGAVEWFLDNNGVNNRFRFYVRKAGGGDAFVQADTLGNPSTDTWYNVIFGLDTAHNQIFISGNGGALDTTAIPAGGVNSSTPPLEFGRIDGASYISGRLDSPGFWKRLLTASERIELYNNGAGLEYPFATLSDFTTPPEMMGKEDWSPAFSAQDPDAAAVYASHFGVHRPVIEAGARREWIKFSMS